VRLCTDCKEYAIPFERSPERYFVVYDPTDPKNAGVKPTELHAAPSSSSVSHTNMETNEVRRFKKKLRREFRNVAKEVEAGKVATAASELRKAEKSLAAEEQGLFYVTVVLGSGERLGVTLHPAWAPVGFHRFMKLAANQVTSCAVPCCAVPCQAALPVDV
jgi:hypothetical protein